MDAGKEYGGPDFSTVKTDEEARELAHRLGLEPHAGHGLDYATAETIAALPQVVELNIGHFMMGEAIFTGLAQTIRDMRAAMDRGRKTLRHYL